MSEKTDPSEASHCPQCGKAVPSAAPHGLCPRCLMAGAETVTGVSTSEHQIPKIDELRAAFPQLEVLELIGRGGMGAVFKARQPRLDRLVALKILPKHLAEDPAFAERFAREGRLLARLAHPNIVTVHDVGEEGGFLFLLMEYVDGVNLRQAIRAESISPQQALATVRSICDALQYAHDEGILHRDVKPENILLDKRGRIKIADFGIAKLLGEGEPAGLTLSGASPGTPHYMAPEQIERPGSVDHRADIYSLGVVFYELLTGELPLGRFPAPSAKAGTVDPRVDEVVLKSLEKERDLRQQSATEMKTQVEGLSSAAGRPQQAIPDAPQQPLPPQPESKSSTPLSKILAIAACVALVVCSVPAVAIVGMMSLKLKLATEASNLAESAERAAMLAELDQEQRQLMADGTELRQRLNDTFVAGDEARALSEQVREIDASIARIEQHKREMHNSSTHSGYRSAVGRETTMLALLGVVGLLIAAAPGALLGWISLAMERRNGVVYSRGLPAFFAAMLPVLIVISAVIYSAALFGAFRLASLLAIGNSPLVLLPAGVGILCFLLLGLWLLRRVWNWVHAGEEPKIPFYVPGMKQRAIGYAFLLLCSLVGAVVTLTNGWLALLTLVFALVLLGAGTGMLLRFDPGRRALVMVVFLLLALSLIVTTLSTTTISFDGIPLATTAPRG